MKKTHLILAALLIAATATIIFVGCKKDKEESVSKEQNNEVQTLLKRIENFQTLREAVNAGAKTDGSMTVEEMRQTLCLVSNYEHSEHETYCLNTTLDTLRVAMPEVDIEGNVSEADVIALYNAFEEALQERMESITDEMDVPSLFSIVVPSTGTRNNDSINIIFTRGQESDPEPVSSPSVTGPFHNVCWYWGGNLGRCDGGIGALLDAADILSLYFTPDTTSPGNGSYQLFWDMEYVEYIATDTFSVHNSSFSNFTYWIPDNIVTPCTDWLFNQYGPLNVGEDEPCLCEDELNCEWFNITEHIVSETGALHYSPNFHSPYYCCVVKDRGLKCNCSNDQDLCDRYHTARVCYTNYSWTNPNID